MACREGVVGSEFGRGTTMAFLNRVSNLLKLNVCKQVSSVSYAPRPSVFQATRCMSSYASTKLFVGGLAWGTDEQTLRDAFSQYGTVLEARIIQDRETGKSRGFVTFDTSEAASSAIEAFDGQELQGQNIRVNFATEKPRGRGSNGGCDGCGGAGYDYGGQSGGYGREGNQGGDGNYGGDVSYGEGGGGFGGGNQFSSGGGYGGSVQGGGGIYSGSKPGFFASLLNDDPSGAVGDGGGGDGGGGGGGGD